MENMCAKMCITVRKCDVVCQTVPICAKLCQSVQNCAKLCQTEQNVRIIPSFHALVHSGTVWHISPQFSKKKNFHWDCNHFVDLLEKTFKCKSFVNNNTII